jgi:hypothetical protein
MRRRKGEISIDARLRRAGLLHVAKIKREDPFRTVDREEINAACRRIAAAGAWDSRAGWGPESGYLLFYFASWAKARAMQHWIDRSGIARRPVPKMGPTKEEKAAKERELMEWALGSGAAREIVQAYRRRMFAGGAHVSALCEAYQVAADLGCRRDGLHDAVEHIIEWARTNHAEWFNRCRPADEALTKAAKTVTAPVAAPPPTKTQALEPPKWRPAF